MPSSTMNSCSPAEGHAYNLWEVGETILDYGLESHYLSLVRR